jgi:hypothetical protein
MKKISISDRAFLLLTGLLAAYQIVVSSNDFKPQTIWFYTTGFGILLVSGLLLLILGFESLESQAVVIISTLIPLSISLGLISEYLSQFTFPYLIFSIIGFGTIVITRYTVRKNVATVVLAVVHGIAGMTIFLLPLLLWYKGVVPAGYTLVSLGGALIGVGGILLAFLKTGKPLLPQESVFTILPIILTLMTLSFVIGFSFP